MVFVNFISQDGDGESGDESIILTASRSEDKLSVSEDDLQKMTEVWSWQDVWLEKDADPGGRDVGRGGEL